MIKKASFILSSIALMCFSCSSTSPIVSESRSSESISNSQTSSDRHENETFVELHFETFNEWLDYYSVFKLHHSERFFLPKDDGYTIDYYFCGYVSKDSETTDIHDLIFTSPSAAFDFNLTKGMNAFVTNPIKKPINNLRATPFFNGTTPTISITSDNYAVGVVWMSEGTGYQELKNEATSVLSCFEKGVEYVF